MSLLTTSTFVFPRNGQSSYLNDRNYFVKIIENKKLYGGDITAAKAHFEGTSVAMGYGFDLKTIKQLTTH